MKSPFASGHGLSEARLAAIDRFLQTRYLDTQHLPCAAVWVARRGVVAHQCTLGFMDIERQRVLQPDTIFRIYSMTKPITSTALMMLVEEGLVDLADPVHRYIPRWRDLRVGLPDEARTASRPMQIVDLLRHTSGLTYGFQQRSPIDAMYRAQKLGESFGSMTLSESIDKLADIPLEFAPGEAWNYSVSTDVLGHLVETISGVEFAEFLRQRIFAPLEMHDTGFHVPESKASRFAACYLATPERRMRLVDDPRASPFLRPPRLVSGGAGLVSTIADYYRFCQMLLNGGHLDGKRIISRKTLELMTMNHLPGGKDLAQLSRSLFSESTYAGVGFGLGFAVTLDPARTLLPGTPGDFSWGGMASTYFWIDPREELIVIFMTQLLPSTTYPLRRELRTLVYSAFDH